MDRDGLKQQRNTSQMERNESGRWRVAEKNTSYHGHCQNRTQQQYSHKSVCAYASVHKSSFNIRPTVLFCSLKIVLVLYKLTWIHQLVNNSSHSIDFFSKDCPICSKHQMTWVEGTKYRMDLEFHNITLLLM